MRIPLLEHPGLYLTSAFLGKNPPEPPQLSDLEFMGEGAEPDYDGLRAELERVMENSADPASSDGKAARLIHEALRLTRREAADMRFWHYLATVRYPHYVAWRYFDARTGKTNKNRYAGLLDDNALSRLWWFGDLTFDPLSTDPYWRTERTAESLEFVKGIVENLFGGNRWLVRGLADVLFNGNGRPPDSIVQKVFTDTNVLLVSIAVDVLSAEEIDSMVRRIHAAATAGV